LDLFFKTTQSLNSSTANCRAKRMTMDEIANGSQDSSAGYLWTWSKVVFLVQQFQQ
jgi:hypothetical protein